jgi:diadenylate cyclase
MEMIWSALSTFLILMKTFSFIDFIDIFVVSFIIYGLIRLLRETRAGQLIKGLTALVVMYLLSFPLHFKLLSTLLDYVFQFSFLVFLIMFQPEIRRALEQIGTGGIGNYGNLINLNDSLARVQENCINNVASCAEGFKTSKTGALIVFEQKTKLGDVIETGTVIDAKASVALLRSLFFNKSALHDGAVIIREGRIYAAGCILPLTKSENLSDALGTRHRAAFGMSEISDAIILVVSEETGEISLAVNGVLKRNYNKDSLAKTLFQKIIFDNEKAKNRKIFNKIISRKNREQKQRTK